MKTMAAPGNGLTGEQPVKNKWWNRKKNTAGQEKKTPPRLHRKWKKKAIIFAVVCVFLAGSSVGLYRLFGAEEERVPVTGMLTYGALNEAIEGSGTTTPADSVTYEINGTVLEWYVEEGQDVEAGDLLYVLDSSEAEDELLEYEVELDAVYEQVSELQENISNQQVTASFSGRIEGIQVEVGDNVQNGSVLATLIDDSTMKATLYFSDSYQGTIRTGMSVTLSIQDQMLTKTGTVTGIQDVDYVTPEGMNCFAVTVSVENPGSFTEGTTVTGWLTDSAGNEVYAAGDAELEYNHSETITAGASGELLQVNAVNYQRVQAGDLLFAIDASGYETQLETLQKQIDNYEKNIADLQEEIDTEYTRYADISGQVVSANYSTNRMTGTDTGVVSIYNQESMQISINVDELNADYLEEGMEVTVYRTTSSDTVFYPATLTYLSLEATASTSGVSTFSATITINSEGQLSSGVTVYYAIDTSGGEALTETVLAPLNALCTYDGGYYLLIKSDTQPENAIDPAASGGSVTDYPQGYYAVPVEVGDYSENYIQILSGAEQNQEVFLRYQNSAPSNGDSTSTVEGESESGGMPGFGGDFGMPSGNFGGSNNMPGGSNMPSMPGGRN